ncbi:MAG: D-(-)-3-hydroxybutyrate oligomer hydrolase [Pseudomonadota bacterium]|nr:D-(-)-3-hydroxybutyrate oligomer hydrolase [Pseudomonadota bacterium]
MHQKINKRNCSRGAALAAAMGAVLVGGCGGGGGLIPQPDINTLPVGVTDLGVKAYRATSVGSGSTAASQDLLTGGLGKSGIISTAAVPAYADPANPTADEMRRNALQSNYRGLVDVSAGGGFGVLYGPNIDLAGNNTLGEGLVPGLESIGILDDASGRKRVTMAVQIPDSFNPESPCVVLAPSSGSRGVYGAIGTAGEWGLKRGCAVALTDAGKGMGLHDLSDDTVHRVDGTRASRTAAGALANFAANISEAARTTFNTAFPNRVALKQAHSQLNPEKEWGSDTLAAGAYALYVLNQQYGADVGSGAGKTVRFWPGNTLIMAASVSNGATAVVQAAERDRAGLIDGVVVAEPGSTPETTSGYGVQVGGAPVASFGRPLMDYFSLANLYQPCAALAPSVTMAEASSFNFIPTASLGATAANRCAQLAAKGLVSGATTDAQAADALAKLRAAGWNPESDLMHNAHYGFGNAAIITMMYSNAYGRFSVTDNLCGMSAGAVAAGVPAAMPVNAKAASFAIGNGTVNGSPASVIYNDSVGGAKLWSLGISPSSGVADFSLDAALCQRALYTGVDTVTGAPLSTASTPTKAQSDAVRAGVAEVLLGGNLRGKPTLIVSGRSDTLLPVNHTARAYTAFNRKVEGSQSRLNYIEVTNAQHFEVFNSASGWDTRFVPLHGYFLQAMNAMYAHLKNGTALPPSQVVRTTPRGGTPGAAPAITAANVPAINAAPAASERIGFAGTSLNVPN